MDKYTTGSLWRKWDPHIHSPASAVYDEFPGKDDAERWGPYLEKGKTESCLLS